MKKPRLLLAEAISKGQEFGPLLVGGRCTLVTRALQSVGALPSNPDNYDSYTTEQRKTLGYEESTLLKLYPWLKQKQICPWCSKEIDESNVIYHPFIQHVCQSEATIEDQCEWMLEVEQELDPLISVAIYFRSEDERLQALWEAKRQNLTLNAFLAASVRMVLQQRLVLTDWACADPPIREGDL